MIEQIGLAVFSLSAVFFSQCRTDALRRWACIFGLCSQPFWFYATWQASQWGIFALSVLYTCTWLHGLRNYWLR